MTSVLSSFFSRDPKAAFSYDLPTSSFTSIDGVSIGDSFKKAEPEELATVFWAPPDTASLRVQTQKLKTMRHPNILTYLDSIEADGTLYLVTERCKPLEAYMRDAKLTPEQRESVVAWGMYQIMSALKFLHEANVSHENLRRAVFVTAAGDWKLGALHRATSFSSPRSDLNQFALLLWELFNGFNDGLAKAEAPGRMPKKLHDVYKRMATPAAAKQSAAELLRDCRQTGGFCKSRYVDTLLFLEEFQLKEATEKTAFFTQLRENLTSFPDDIAKYKLLPRLIHTYEYGDAGPNILIPLFKLGRLLEEDEYQRKIVPCLVKLFGSPDRTTRVKLLEKIDEFAPHLTPAIVNEKIYSNLAQGFLDTSPAVRECTVKAMVVLADKLNNHNLNTDLMKYLARLQGSDEHGGIRTNTTICLGKIACHLDPSCRQRILIGAFTRGLKDPFPPSRMASVLALSATQQFYTLLEIANRVVPALAPLTCDPEKQVRDQAFSSLRGFLEKLEKASENPALIPELEAAVKAGGKGLLGSDKVPQWASWALKSLSGKFYKAPQAADAAVAADGKPAASEDAAKGSAETNSTRPSSARAKKEVSGWGELEEEDDWNDAPEAPAASGEGDEDDWSDGWAVPKTSTASSIASKSTSSAKSAGGKPQLAGSRSTKSKNPFFDEDEIDDFAANTKSKATTTSASSSIRFGITEKAPITNSAGGGGGWDEVGEEGGLSSGGGWEEDSWAAAKETEQKAIPKLQPSAAKSTAADREARRAEMATKNEAKKAELAAKRAARGAMKLGGGPKPAAALKEFNMDEW